MNKITTMTDPHEIMQSVLMKGDLANLSAQEKNAYYAAMCKSIGLNPLTKPFEYIVLNGKLRLYALKDATDQLRSIHGISVTELVESERDGVFMVKAKVSNSEGRTDVSVGAVNIGTLKGEALANALMKAETKAKRRATLSICGLGMLDESEVSDIPVPPTAPEPPPRPRVPSPKDVQTEPDGPHKIVGGTFKEWADNFIKAVGTAGDDETVKAWISANKDQLAKLKAGSPADYDRADSFTARHRQFLSRTKAPDPITTGPQSPDIKTDYEGWLTWAHKEIASHVDPGLLETWWNAEVETRMEDIFPPDALELTDAYDKAQADLNKDDG